MANKSENHACNLSYVDTLLKKAIDVEHSNPEEALSLSKEALNLAKTCHFKPQQAHSYVRIGRCYWIIGNYKDALHHLNQGLDIATSIQDMYMKAEAHNGLGNVFVIMELMDQAIHHYNAALNIAEAQGYIELESKVYNNTGTLHEELKNYREALKFYLKSLEKTEEINDYYGTAIANFNIGNMYLSMDQLKEAEEYIMKAYLYAKEFDKMILLTHSHYALGKFHQKNRNYSKSIQALNEGIKLADTSRDLNILIRIYMELATSYDLQGDEKNAIHFFDAAFKLANQIGVDEFIPKIHEQMALFYEKRNQIEEAAKAFHSYYDSNKILEENRRKERIKSLEFQSKLKKSIEETEAYRKLNDELRESYIKTHVLSEIGQGMTATMDLNSIFELLYENINKLMDANTLGVGLYNIETNQIHFDLFIENGRRQESFSLSLDNKKSWNIWAFNNQKLIQVNDAEVEYKDYIEELTQTRGELMHSAMYAPLTIESDTIGVMTIQSKEKNAYNATQKDLFQTLTSYLAIAIKNAQKTKELAKLNRKLKLLSELDGLTGISNRRMFDETFELLWEESKLTNVPLSLAIIDIDNFKRFNDTYGHIIGDRVIIEVAQLLYRNANIKDSFVARYGGDEFVMLLPNCSKDEAEVIAISLMDSMKRMNEGVEIDTKIQVSIGVASTYPDDQKTTDDFLKVADDNLYISKNQGKNKYTIGNY